MAFGHALAMSHHSPTGGLLGPNGLLNGDFSTDTVWVKGAGWTIAAGLATITLPAAASTLAQAYASGTGSTYLVEFTISGYASGAVRVRLQNSGALSSSGQPAYAANGTYSVFLTAASAGNEFAFFATNSSASMSIDNVSLRRVL